MAFAPIVRASKEMDARLFRREPMDLMSILLDLDVAARITYDADRNTLFLNFGRLQVRTPQNIEAVRSAVSRACENIGHRVAVVVNYDGFRIDDGLLDA